MNKSKGGIMRLWPALKTGAQLWAIIFIVTTVFVMFGGNHWWYAGLVIALATIYTGWRLLPSLKPDLMTEAVAYGFWWIFSFALLDYLITRHLDAEFYTIWTYWTTILAAGLTPALWFKYAKK